MLIKNKIAKIFLKNLKKKYFLKSLNKITFNAYLYSKFTYLKIKLLFI